MPTQNLETTPWLFAFLSLGMAAWICWLGKKTLSPSAARRLAVGISIWTAYTAFLALSGVLSQYEARPPRLLLFLVPMLIGLLSLQRWKEMGVGMLAIPAPLLIAPQAFRIAVELLLARISKLGLLPHSMTYHGSNWDIGIGLSAPLIALAVGRGGILGTRIALAWNLIGLIVLTNVVGRGILSVPGPQRLFYEDVPNTALSHFPYIWLGAILVPLAYTLHFFSIRKSIRDMRHMREIHLENS